MSTEPHKVKMYGYKAFNSKLQGLKNFQYTVGNTYSLPEGEYGPVEDSVICKKGFHFCQHPVFIENYHPWAADKSVRFAEVEALGDLDYSLDDKFCTNVIKIVRELSRSEFIQRCTGKFECGIGNIYYYRNAKLHRRTGPAVIELDGDVRYYRNGKLTTY